MTTRTLLFNEDNVRRLHKLPANSIHSCVTDPPYGLSSHPDSEKMLRDWLTKGYHEHKSKSGFMNKEWDSFVPQPNTWREVLRVLKPGAYCLAFFSARTYDLGVLSMRLAGFNVVDTIVWHHAQGFPKSVDISKCIDKKLGKSRKVIGHRTHPTLKDKSKICRQGKQQYHASNSIKDEWDITEPASQQAKQWDGWGSALKPASEYIVVCQKPFDTTIVQNVLTNGCGAMNIDRCRIGFTANDDTRIGKGYTHKAMAGITPGEGKKLNQDGTENTLYKQDGRYPANVVLTHAPECKLVGQVKVKGKQRTAGNRTANDKDGWGVGKGGCSYKKGSGAVFSPPTEAEVYECVPDCPIHILNTQSGDRSSARKGNPNNPKRGGNSNPLWGMSDGRQTKDYRDSGGAARFFFCAKAGRSERNGGLKGRNPHPTVKPLALMRYLTKLVTKPNGIVLDPFMGSGTTGVACVKEGFKFIGIEREKEYYETAKKRIRFAEETVLKKLF